VTAFETKLNRQQGEIMKRLQQPTSNSIRQANSPRQTRPDRRGFTLTEMLIVLAILVLLASLVGPRLLGSKKKADINATKAQIGMFQAALETYAVDLNRFPKTEEGLMALVSESAGGDSAELDTGDAMDDESGSNWGGPYLKTTTLPKDPWGKSFKYEYPPTRSKGDMPEIWSLGPDGEEGTDDDVVSWTGGANLTDSDAVTSNE
jgi:general secretion pathway protein G